MNLNNNYEDKKFVDEEEEDEETLIINDDLFEQKDMSEEEHIIQNEIKDEDFSYISNHDKKKHNNNSKTTNKNINHNNNNNASIVQKNIKGISKYADIINNDNNVNLNNKMKKKEMNIVGQPVQSIEIGKKEQGKHKQKNNNNKENNNNQKELKTNNSQILDNKIKNKNIYISKELSNSNNNKSMILNQYKHKNLLTSDSESLIKSEYKKKSSDNIRYNINDLIDKRNKKTCDTNNSNSYNSKRKKRCHYIKRSTSNNNKSRAKDKIKNGGLNNGNNNSNKNIKNAGSSSRKKDNKNMNKKEDNEKDKIIHNKSKSQNIYNINYTKNNQRIKNIYFDTKNGNNNILNEKEKKNELTLGTGVATGTGTVTGTGTGLEGVSDHNQNYSGILFHRKKIYEYNAEKLKIIFIRKINNQIEEIIKRKEKIYLTKNNNLYFLGFCDLLFELGFLHIKETEISDISKISDNIKNLYTQPFTNRDLLCEDFLYNEQRLLICAWKTILNNFQLAREFDNLPQENEEIALDDFKLFVFIITGLFIGYTYNFFINSDNKDYMNLTCREPYNKFISNYLKNEITPKTKKSNESIERLWSKNYNKFELSNNCIFNNRFNYSPSPKKGTMYIMKNSDSNILYQQKNNNILYKILENKQKTDFNYKKILKIKNFFIYFAELRKLYIAYKKNLKNLEQKISIEKYTFYPTINKNNDILLHKYPPSMSFLERNDLIRSKNLQKMKILEDERRNELLKECTFKPFGNNKKIKIDPIEISNRLYYNSRSKKKKT